MGTTSSPTPLRACEGSFSPFVFLGSLLHVLGSKLHALGFTKVICGGSSHQGWMAKQERPTTTCNELGTFLLSYLTRILAHYKLRQPIVSLPRTKKPL